MLDPESGGGALRILERHRTSGHHALPLVDVRHPQATRFETPPNAFDDALVYVEWEIEHRRHRLSGQIIVGRSQTAAQDEQVRAVQCLAEHSRQVIEIVTNDGLGPNVEAQLIETAGQKERIGVGPEGRQELAAHGDDLCPDERHGSASHAAYAIHSGASHHKARSPRCA